MEDESDITRAMKMHTAERAALLIAVGALISTHPNQTGVHLALTTLLETQLGNGILGKMLDDAQHARVREIVEWLGALKPSSIQPPGVAVPPETDQ